MKKPNREKKTPQSPRKLDAQKAAKVVGGVLLFANPFAG